MDNQNAASVADLKYSSSMIEQPSVITMEENDQSLDLDMDISLPAIEVSSPDRRPGTLLTTLSPTK